MDVSIMTLQELLPLVKKASIIVHAGLHSETAIMQISTLHIISYVWSL